MSKVNEQTERMKQGKLYPPLDANFGGKHVPSVTGYTQTLRNL